MDQNNSFVYLDSSSIEEFISKSVGFKERYDNIQNTFNTTVSTLLESWKGLGADAFERDAENIRTNITSLHDILSTMCDTLTDCLAVIIECDTELGLLNRKNISEN